ncbi:hypothetical protein [Streptomyces sp. NPDC088766]|uniref:hypothetical protein n=1 Tax=Streptomyces sp. NPDC088766 TaxID=3365893 RepID=UPI00380A7098
MLPVPPAAPSPPPSSDGSPTASFPSASSLTTARATGSYAVVGTVLALFGTSAVLLMPLRAALVDRHGPRHALPPVTAAYAVLPTALAAATWRTGARPVVPGALAALAGACAPPLGPVMRVARADHARDRRLVQRVYGLDGVAEELLYVCGPVPVGVLARCAPPAAGVLLSAALIAVCFTVAGGPQPR